MRHLGRYVGWFLVCASGVKARGQSYESDSANRADFVAESLALATSHGVASRSAHILTLRSRNGSTRRFTDVIVDGDQAQRYLYRGYVPALDVHVVEVTFYEGGSFLVFHARSGTAKRVPGRPVASPDGHRFAVASLDLEAGYDPNRLEVWRITPTGFAREFALDGGRAWAPDSLAWRTPDSLKYVRVVMDANGHYTSAPRLLVRQGTTWFVRRRRLGT